WCGAATNPSIRSASAGSNSPISRTLGTWRSGSTSRCTSARGLMSLIPTKPSPSRTWSPSLYSRQKRQSSGSEDSLLGDRSRTDADELAHGRIDEPRRIVVAVAAAGAIDENDVVRAELRAPALDARLV